MLATHTTQSKYFKTLGSLLPNPKPSLRPGYAPARIASVSPQAEVLMRPLMPIPVQPSATRLNILVAEEDAALRSACCQAAASLGHVLFETEQLQSIHALIQSASIDVLLLNLKPPMGQGLDLIEELRLLHPRVSVVVMTASNSVETAVEAMRGGAVDLLTKPFDLTEFTTVLNRIAETREGNEASRTLREQLRTGKGMGMIIGTSPEMERLYRILSKVALSTHPVLILGESGTGKEMIARSIHQNGPNANKPFIPVDCGSLVPTLIESELFGYVKGAFTGANRSKEGLLASAEGGTVFLDEIGELPLDLQSKLLRALQEKEIRPVGATHRIPINVRVLAATNRDLATMVEKGTFRKDLYYRLNVVNLRIPSLRDRKDDIPLLVQHFLDQQGREHNTHYQISDDALRTMMDYDWPGNVRELENSIERASALSSGPLLHIGDLPTQLQDHRMQAHYAQMSAQTPKMVSDQASTVVTPLAEMEKQAILDTIRKLKGDKLLAARLLGIGKTTLYRKLKEYGISDGTE